MSKYTYIGGDLIEEIGGSYKSYSGGGFNISSDKEIILHAKKGIVFGNDPEDAPKSVLDVMSHECVIEFRILETYKGEFGFDWMRVNDKVKNNLLPEEAYAQSIENGYNMLSKNHEYESQAEAYKELEKEYYNIPIHNTPKPEYGDKSPIIRQYYVPYLQIFSEKYSKKVTVPEGMPKPPFEATLRTLVEIKGDEPEQIRVIFNSEFFRVNGKDGTDEHPVLLDTTPGAQHLGKDITIKCIKDFDSRKSIDVYMYPKITDEERKSGNFPKRRLVGRMIVKPNDSEHRNTQKFIFVNVKTSLDKIKNNSTKGITISEKKNLQNALYQALVVGEFEDYEKVFDISKDPNFMITTDEKGNKHYGKFIYEKERYEPIKKSGKTTDGGLCTDYNNGEMFAYLKEKFLMQEGNKQYENHFFVFGFATIAYNMVEYSDGKYKGVPAQIQDIGIKNACLFTHRGDFSLSHEGLHGLGLYHTHREDMNSPLEKKRKFVFKQYATNNVMSYPKNELSCDTKITTWLWQWEIIQGSFRKI